MSYVDKYKRYPHASPQVSRVLLRCFYDEGEGDLKNKPT